MKIILFFLIYITHISIIFANDLKKMALDGDPVSMCKYAQELHGEEKNKLFKNVDSLHFFPLGGIEASASFAKNIGAKAA